MNAAFTVTTIFVFVNIVWTILTGRPLRPSATQAVIFLVCALSYLVLHTMQHNWPWAAFSLVITICWIRYLWNLWKRSRRKGRLAALGNKARARIAEMKRKLAERPARPVLRPVPQGI